LSFNFIQVIKQGYLIYGIMLFCFVSKHVAGGNPLYISDIKCENKIEAIGVPLNHAVFSWNLKSDARNQWQTAYQLMLASTKDMLDKDTPDVWNSGKVKSADNLFATYKGNKLSPASIYFWKVRVWDKDSTISDWSETGRFITALDQDGWKGASWIAYDKLPDSMKVIPGMIESGYRLGYAAKARCIIPYLRKQFTLQKDIASAIICISGLGQYELHINGQKVGNNFLTPGWTNYLKVCLYNTYDVTAQLKKGENAIGVIAGNGFYYINREAYRKFAVAFDYPKVICKLLITYSDGSKDSIASGNDWKTSPSPIVYSSIYGGELYDAQKEQSGWDTTGFDDKHWKAAIKADLPGGLLMPESGNPLQEMQEFETVKITKPTKNSMVYDFGQNASGIIEVMLQGHKGQSVILMPAELIDSAGNINQTSSGAPYVWGYTLKSDGVEVWKPRFTYYGFRYVQVLYAVSDSLASTFSKPQILKLKFIHTRNSSPSAGSFECSNDQINKINDLIGWAVKSNMASIITDCPHREKLGWLEETYLMGGSIHYNFDIYLLYKKIVDDIIACQYKDGLVSNIAPNFVALSKYSTFSPEWGSAAIILPWLIYKWYGDLAIIEKAYTSMRGYMDYLRSRTYYDMLINSMGDWCDMGKKPQGDAQLTPVELTASAIYYYDLCLMAKMAKMTANDSDVVYFNKLAGDVKTSFNKRLYNDSLHIYSTGSQTAQAMPLFFGLVDEENYEKVFNNLLDSIIQNNNRITAGEIGLPFLLKTLQERGQSQLIYDMLKQDDVPGYVYQIKKGATALTELWSADENASNNHLMMGHAMEWFYSGLAGINQRDSSVAYKHIVISPQLVSDLKWVNSCFNSPYGKIISNWKIKRKNFLLDVEIPVNTDAEIILPLAESIYIFENNKRIIQSKGNKTMINASGSVGIKVGSGKYSFRVKRFKRK
jgi:alpha-L-rhamnosidase